MFRNQYDTDVTIWSPQGRLYQVEYSQEAVKQGSASVGLRSKKHAVLATLKRAQSELASYQRKVFKIDDHAGIAISGLTADGRILCRYLQNECINHRFVFESAIPVGRLVRQVADKNQSNTQKSWKRPYGVGLLVAGCDGAGPHIYQTCPSGNYWEYRAMAIGARSQSAKTYLERHFEGFPDMGVDELVRHALLALQATLQGESELTASNCTIAIVGVDDGGVALPFTVLEDANLEPYIEAIKADETPGGEDEALTDAPAPGGADDTAAAPPAPEGGDGGGEGGGPTPMET